MLLSKCISEVLVFHQPLTLHVSPGTWGVGVCVWMWPPNTRSVPQLNGRMESWIDTGSRTHKWKPARKTSLGQMKDKKLPESWRISDQDMETPHQLAKDVSPRGGKGSSIKHMGWGLQDGMDMENATISEFWKYFSLSNKDDSPFRRLLNPGRPWTPFSEKKTTKNQFCF